MSQSEEDMGQDTPKSAGGVAKPGSIQSTQRASPVPAFTSVSLLSPGKNHLQDPECRCNLVNQDLFPYRGPFQTEVQGPFPSGPSSV